AHNLGGGVSLPATMRKALEDYPAPAPGSARAPDALDDEARRRLATLGYVGAGAAPVVRKDAPRPADMTRLVGTVGRASGFFATEQYGAAIPLLEGILADDPNNLDAMLRLATAHSKLGHDAKAVETFEKAAALAPKSPDVRTYLGLHYAHGAEWERALPLLEQTVKEDPERLPAVEALARIRERQSRFADAVQLWQQSYRMRAPSADEWGHLGSVAMEA